MSLQALTGELYRLFESKDYRQCQKILLPVKIELIKNNLLVPVGANTSTKDQLNDLKIAEHILEIGALSTLLSNDYQSFEKYMSQLKPFYHNQKLHSKAEVNTDTTKIISLYLLYLLSQGLISKYHIEIEAIYSCKEFDVEKDRYLNYPINLERNLMEGNYNKIWNLLKAPEDQLPCKEFTHFIDTLITALRFEIAKSMEKTYSSLPVNNCKSLLYFPQEQSNSMFQDFCEKEFEVTNWTFNNGTIYFGSSGIDEQDSDNSNATIVKNVLIYADQIESIV